VAINPATPIELLSEALPYTDFILLMSVNPGFGGQSFIPTMTDKLRRLKEMITLSRYPVRIEIDGGVDESNIGAIVAAGAEMIVAGSAVFGREDRAAAVRSLLEKGTNWI
jgi:ribulose-phosphate 3-epimerase